ncbi:MAG: tRNA lysidine(34) synthetase TilS [Alphaproteobacteria bacterium]|nr:tRNA lysidine(34) synthetase TilS [Alphaproteobacteria bacterium]
MTEALDAVVMAGLMARFDPFEPAPVVAVGVSGGADSMALVLLADLWARKRGGRAVAITIDHGLRVDSGGEARQVGAWLAERGIAHTILSWQGPKPTTGVQATARQARRALLGEHCRSEATLHLLLGHHRGDQAETVALRREDQSGPDGLAAMAVETATSWGRVLRPLLGLPKSALTGFLSEVRQPWIEDPSNRDERHARVRLRQRIADDASEVALAEAAETRGLLRIESDRAVADALARHVALDPAGGARVAAALLEFPDDLAQAALARVIVTVGNLDYPPRSARLARLHAHLKSGIRRARTLGGCRILPGGDAWLVVREPSALPPAVPFADGAATWDRFHVRLPDGRSGGSLSLGPLGVTTQPDGVRALPGALRPSLAAIHDLDGVVAVPHLRWVRPGADPWLGGAISWIFPRQGLSRAEFAVT